MTGIELAAGCMAAWAWNKGRRVARRADGEVDAALDKAMDRVQQVIASKLKGHSALKKLAAEAAASADQDQPQVSERTLRKATNALARAANGDPVFARCLATALSELHAAKEASGRQAGAVTVIASGTGAGAVGGSNTGILSTGSGSVNIQHQ
jgi:hypothetical protein